MFTKKELGMHSEAVYKNVLLTGASTGIGYELAYVFAKKGHNLIVTARSQSKLEEMANDLQLKYGITVTIIVKDLSKPNAAQEVFDEVKDKGIEIDILVNNAGIGNCGLFHHTDISKDLEMIQLNITALTLLTKLFTKQMVQRRQGKILNVASTGSYQPGPLIAVYYATKAYVLSFSQGIANELKPYNVSVTVLCPGATKTEFSKNAGKGHIKGAAEARSVAEAAYKGLMKNQLLIIPGIMNTLMVIGSKLLPGKISAYLVRKVQQSAIDKF